MESKSVLKKKDVSDELYIYRDLILDENPDLTTDELVERINNEFNVEISSNDIYLLDNPSINELEEDYRFIYKHCL